LCVGLTSSLRELTRHSGYGLLEGLPGRKLQTPVGCDLGRACSRRSTVQCAGTAAGSPVRSELLVHVPDVDTHDGDGVWRRYANSLRGRAAKFDLTLTPLRPQDTRRPQWESYSLRTRMGLSRVERATLLALDRYLESLEAAQDAGEP
jgi:hypothetical protein